MSNHTGSDELREDVEDLMYLYDQAENTDVRYDAVNRMIALIDKAVATKLEKVEKLVIGEDEPTTQPYKQRKVGHNVVTLKAPNPQAITRNAFRTSQHQIFASIIKASKETHE